MIAPVRYASVRSCFDELCYPRIANVFRLVPVTKMGTYFNETAGILLKIGSLGDEMSPIRGSSSRTSCASSGLPLRSRQRIPDPVQANAGPTPRYRLIGARLRGPASETQ